METQLNRHWFQIDKYGREGEPYEDGTFEVPKENDCLWIVEPDLGNSINYNFSNCNIVLNTISNITHFEGQNNDDNIMFIKGGIVTDEGIRVAQAGDVVSCKIVKQLVALFPQVANATTIMTISRTTNE